MEPETYMNERVYQPAESEPGPYNLAREDGMYTIQGAVRPYANNSKLSDSKSKRSGGSWDFIGIDFCFFYSPRDKAMC